MGSRKMQKAALVTREAQRRDGQFWHGVSEKSAGAQLPRTVSLPERIRVTRHLNKYSRFSHK
jgi:hypothetical protein